MAKKRVTKKSFLAGRRRDGRTDGQAAADWKGRQRFRKEAATKRKKSAKKRKAQTKALKPRTKKATCRSRARALVACKNPRKKTATKKKAAKKKTRARRNPGLPVLVMNPSPKRRSTVAKRRRTKKRPVRRRRRRRNPSMAVGATAVAAVGGLVPAIATFLLDGTDLSRPMQAGIVGGGGTLGAVLLSGVAPNLAKGMAGGSLSIGVLEVARSYLAPPFGSQMVAPTKQPQPIENEETKGLRQRRSQLAAAGQNVATAEWRAVRAQLGCPEYGCAECAQMGCPYRAHVAARQQQQSYGAVRASLGSPAETTYNWSAIQAELRGLNL